MVNWWLGGPGKVTTNGSPLYGPLRVPLSQRPSPQAPNQWTFSVLPLTVIQSLATPLVFGSSANQVPANWAAVCGDGGTGVLVGAGGGGGPPQTPWLL